jgi:hypothetical protein
VRCESRIGGDRRGRCWLSRRMSKENLHRLVRESTNCARCRWPGRGEERTAASTGAGATANRLIPRPEAAVPKPAPPRPTSPGSTPPGPALPKPAPPEPAPPEPAPPEPVSPAGGPCSTDECRGLRASTVWACPASRLRCPVDSRPIPPRGDSSSLLPGRSDSSSPAIGHGDRSSLPPGRSHRSSLVMGRGDRSSPIRGRGDRSSLVMGSGRDAAPDPRSATLDDAHPRARSDCCGTSSRTLPARHHPRCRASVAGARHGGVPDPRRDDADERDGIGPRPASIFGMRSRRA